MKYVQLKQQATNSFEQNQYEQAVALYERCMELDAQDLDNYWYLGLSLLLQGDESLAQTVWMSAFLQGTSEEIDNWTTDLIEIIEKAAAKCIKNKQFDEAEQLCWHIQELNPDYAYSYLGLGVIQIERGEYQTAIDTLKNFIELKSGVYSAHHNLGVCFQNLGMYQEAIEHFQKAISLDNNCIITYEKLADSLMREARYQEAILYFQHCLKFDSDNINAHIGLGEGFYCVQQLEKGVEHFKTALKLSEQSSNSKLLELVLIMLGVCFAKKGNIDVAFEYLYRATKIDSNVPFAYYHLARCYRNKGELEQAFTCYNKALQLDPGLSQAKRELDRLNQSLQAKYSLKLQQGYNIWDAILIRDEDYYRLLYLQGEGTAYPAWCVGEMGMAVSKDLTQWQHEGIILKPDPEKDWESGRILSGCLRKENETYYLFYSAASSERILNETIALATSVDGGVTWQRRSRPLLELDKRFYDLYNCLYLKKISQHVPWRDPYVLQDDNTGKYYMFITTSFKNENVRCRGCIGLAVADKIDGPYEVLPPAVVPLLEGTEESIFVEMERPQIIYKNGQYNLFFSVGMINLNPMWLKKVGKDGITGFSLYWYVSDNITGPFRAVSEKPIVKGSSDTGLYGTNFMETPDGKFFAYGTHYRSQTLEVSGRFPVNWEGKHLEILVDDELKEV